MAEYQLHIINQLVHTLHRSSDAHLHQWQWWEAGGLQLTLGRLYAGFSSTRTPSDAPYTGFLSIGISSDIRSPNNETFRAVDAEQGGA